MSPARPVARSLRRWIAGTIVAAAVLRAAACVAMSLLAGPLLGLVTVPLFFWVGPGALLAEYLAAAAAVVAGLVVAARATTGGRRQIRRARTVGVVLIADTALYLSSALIAAEEFQVSAVGVTVFAVVAVPNLALVAAATVIIRRAGEASLEQAGSAGRYVRKPRLSEVEVW